MTHISIGILKKCAKFHWNGLRQFLNQNQIHWIWSILQRSCEKSSNRHVFVWTTSQNWNWFWSLFSWKQNEKKNTPNQFKEPEQNKGFFVGIDQHTHEKHKIHLIFSITLVIVRLHWLVIKINRSRGAIKAAKQSRISCTLLCGEWMIHFLAIEGKETPKQMTMSKWPTHHFVCVGDELNDKRQK